VRGGHQGGGQLDGARLLQASKKNEWGKGILKTKTAGEGVSAPVNQPKRSKEEASDLVKGKKKKRGEKHQGSKGFLRQSMTPDE